MSAWGLHNPILPYHPKENPTHDPPFSFLHAHIILSSQLENCTHKQGKGRGNQNLRFDVSFVLRKGRLEAGVCVSFSFPSLRILERRRLLIMEIPILLKVRYLITIRSWKPEGGMERGEQRHVTYSTGAGEDDWTHQRYTSTWLLNVDPRMRELTSPGLASVLLCI